MEWLCEFATFIRLALKRNRYHFRVNDYERREKKNEMIRTKSIIPREFLLFPFPPAIVRIPNRVVLALLTPPPAPHLSASFLASFVPTLLFLAPPRPAAPRHRRLFRFPFSALI